MKYYALFIDDHSRYTWLYPFKRKSDFFETFVKFHKMVEKQFSKSIKIFQSDGGGEFSNFEFVEYLENCGVVRHISCPHTPEQNGIAERNHKHVVETGLTLLLHAKLPYFYELGPSSQLFS